MKRVLVIGLDGFDPVLAGEWLPELPNLRALMERGIHGSLESIVQPVTPAAWTAMISGRDPGHFGFTDFVCRSGNSYSDLKLVHSRMVRVPTIFSMLAESGRRVWMVGVPVSYPPVALANGGCVSCFMAPSLTSGITHPLHLQAEILAHTSAPYLLDVSVTDAAESADRDDLIRRIRELDRQRFDVTRYLMQAKEWDLLFMVCMGTDRIGHYFMRFQDPTHLRHDPDSRFRDAVKDHYRYCDERLGELVELAGPDTVVMVVSDHGMQRMDGKVNLNDWLREEGYLHLTEPVEGPTSLSKAPIDWGRTQAWARGYAGQIYLNMRSREPHGCVEPSQANQLLDDIAQRLSRLTGPTGERIKVDIFRGRDLYRGAQAAACPDLCVQFDGVRYLTSDQVGHDRLVTPITELGFDDAAHSPNGFFAMAGPSIPSHGHFSALHLYDVAPTILELLGVTPPADLEGRAIHAMDGVYSADDEAALTSRLRALYLE